MYKCLVITNHHFNTLMDIKLYSSHGNKLSSVCAKLK